MATRPSPSPRTNPTGSPAKSLGSASRPPTRSPRPWAWRWTIPSGSRPARYTPCPRPATRATPILPETDLGDRATELLTAPREKVDAAIRDLYAERGAVAERVIRDGGEARFAPFVAALAEPRATYGAAAPKPADELAVYLPPFYHAESNVAKQAQRIAACPPERSRLAEFQKVDFAAMFEYPAGTSSLQLSEKQQAGVRAALTRPWLL